MQPGDPIGNARESDGVQWREMYHPAFVDGMENQGARENAAFEVHVDGATLLVLRSLEDYSGGGGTDWRWHLSVSGPGRVPTWGELAAVAHAIRPGVGFVMAVPPRSWWMSVHDHVLHLTQTKDDNLVEQWRANARGDVPTAGVTA